MTPDEQTATDRLLERVRPAFEGWPDGLLVIAGDGRLIDANPAAARILGAPADELVGRRIHDFAAPGEDPDATWEEICENKARDSSTLLARADGTLIEVECTATDGLISGRNLVLIRDVTRRNRTARDASFQAEVLDHVEAAVVAIDRRGRITHWNKASERLYGWSRDEAIGRWVRDVVVPAEAEATADEVWSTVQTGRSWEGETLVRRRDGEPLAVWNLNAPILDAAGEIAGYVGIAVDITERRNQEALLAARAMQQEAVAELGQRVLAADDLATALQDAVATVAHVLDVDIVTLLEKAPDDLLYVRVATGLDPEQVAQGTIAIPLVAPAYRALNSGEPAISEDPTGSPEQPVETRDVKSIADVPVGDTTGGIWGVLSALAEEHRHFTTDDLHFLTSVANVLAGAIHRVRVDAEIRHAALHDPLTGLPNRASFTDTLATTLAEGGNAAVLFVDLDRFKLVNDSLGHAAGDELLVAVAERLRTSLRPDDALARFAGDEYVLLCRDVSRDDDAAALAERVADAFAEPFQLGERSQYVTVSIGIALPRNLTQDAEELIRDADAAMYRAKERGRARYEVFDERLRVNTLMRMRTENDLRHALALSQLEVHYQPIVSLRDGDLAGFEGLLRWAHPRRGQVPPSEFIPIAEDSGLIGEIGSWVLREVAAQVNEWRGRGGPKGWPLMIGVNVSPRQFATGTFADEVALVMQELGLGPDELAIEITESVLMEETQAAVETLQSLKALGVRMILDDFGTGYSSLSYLDRFPLDGLKIDRSFVAGLDGGGSSAIVGAIVSMAQSLDLAITAEGVETVDQLDQLRALGVNSAQGYYFGRPGPPSAHADLLGADLRRVASGDETAAEEAHRDSGS